MTLPKRIRERQLATSDAMTRRYADLSHDYNPLHLDAQFAAGTAFGAPIAHGTMALNLLIEAIDETFGPGIREEHLDIRFSAPVRVGETVRAGGEKVEGEDGAYNVWVKTEAGEVTLKGMLRVAVSP